MHPRETKILRSHERGQWPQHHCWMPPLPQWQPSSWKSQCGLIDVSLLCTFTLNCCIKWWVVLSSYFPRQIKRPLHKVVVFFPFHNTEPHFQSPIAGFLADGPTQEKTISAIHVFQQTGARFLPCVAQKMLTDAEVTSLLFTQLLLRCLLHAEMTQK